MKEDYSTEFKLFVFSYKYMFAYKIIKLLKMSWSHRYCTFTCYNIFDSFFDCNIQ